MKQFVNLTGNIGSWFCSCQLPRYFVTWLRHYFNLLVWLCQFCSRHFILCFYIFFFFFFVDWTVISVALRVSFRVSVVVKSRCTAYCDLSETFSVPFPDLLTCDFVTMYFLLLVCPSFPALSSKATNLAIFESTTFPDTAFVHMHSANPDIFLIRSLNWKIINPHWTMTCGRRNFWIGKSCRFKNNLIRVDWV